METKTAATPSLYAILAAAVTSKVKLAEGSNASSFDNASRALDACEHPKAAWFKGLRQTVLTIAGSLKLTAKASFAGDETVSGKANVKAALAKLNFAKADKAETALLRKQAAACFRFGSAMAYEFAGEREAVVDERK